MEKMGIVISGFKSSLMEPGVQVITKYSTMRDGQIYSGISPA